MAKMRTSVEIRNQVLELKKQGKGKKAIARTLKIGNPCVIRVFRPIHRPVMLGA